MIDLKPCPFCGGKPKFLVEKFGMIFDCIIYCEDCEVGTRTYHDEQDAISAWNSRVLEENIIPEEPTITVYNAVGKDKVNIFDSPANSYVNGYKDGWKDCSDLVKEQIYKSNMTAEKQ